MASHRSGFILALAFLCGAEAYVAGGSLAITNIGGSAQPPLVRSASVQSEQVRVPVVRLAEEGKALNPVAVATIGLGSAGIFFAAFLTSTGSPPNGLALAFTTLVIVTAGANFAGSDD
jgi:hypothetical protein